MKTEVVLFLIILFLLQSQVNLILLKSCSKASPSLKDGWIRITASNKEYESKLKENEEFEKSQQTKDRIPNKFSFFYTLSQEGLFIYSNVTKKRLISHYPKLLSVKRLEIKALPIFKEFCFTVTAEDNYGYEKKISGCFDNQEERNLIFCQIKKLLNQYCAEDQPVKIFNQPIIVIATPSPTCNESWDYYKRGSDWQCDCKEGKFQSPINIPLICQSKEDALDKTAFEFNSIKNTNMNLVAELKENRIQIEGEFMKMVTPELVRYRSTHLEFHLGSEHLVNGKRYDLEAQIYFDSDTNPGRKAAIAILFEIVPGAPNAFFEKNINVISLPTQLDPKKVIEFPNFNLQNLFKKTESDDYRDFSYYYYIGSITAPPCTEEVEWFIVSNPIPISEYIKDYFKDSLKRFDANLVEIPNAQIQNSRDDHPIASRTVFYFDQLKYLTRFQEEIKDFGLIKSVTVQA